MTYYWGNSNHPLFSAMSVTALLNDGSPGDTTTSATPQSSASYSGSSGNNSLNVAGTAILDLGGSLSVSAWQFTTSLAYPFNPGQIGPPSCTYVLDYTTGDPDSGPYTTLSSGSLGTATTSGVTNSGSSAVSARYLRLTILMTGGSSLTSFTVAFSLSDFRATSQACNPPSAPTIKATASIAGANIYSGLGGYPVIIVTN